MVAEPASARTPSALPGSVLIGRGREQDSISRLLQAAREGAGGVLALHGEAGVGKTALLDYAIEAGHDLGIARTWGVEGEMELPFAAVQQLCSPLLDLADRLPGPQRQALEVAFGLSAGSPPTPYLVGLAVLGLLSEAAERRPMVIVVDDAQWLDRESARTLAFVARRLVAERVAMVLAARQLDELLTGLPDLAVGPLGRRDARLLLDSRLPALLDEPVLERIVDEARGNPLALLELPRQASPTQLAGGFDVPSGVPVSASIEKGFAQRLERLQPDARQLLLLAAADPLGDATLVWRAAGELGIPGSAAASLEEEGLLQLEGRVAFRHPLVRSAVYGAARADERRGVHRALGLATDPDRDPDRRAWHLAQAASVPDEALAAELERSAGRAQARGGVAAVAGFLERAAVLTPDPVRRAERQLAAAVAKRDAGDPEAALVLLGAESGEIDALGGARAELLRAQIALGQRRADEAGRLFMSAANRLEALDPELARSTWLEALGGALARDIDVPGGASGVAAAARAAPRAGAAPRPVDALLEALATRLTDGYAAAAPALARALELQLSAPVTRAEAGRPLTLSRVRDADIVALEMWDAEAAHVLAAREVEVARETGAVGQLQVVLSFLARSHMLAGELRTAALLLDESQAIAESIGSPALVNAPILLAVFRGDEAKASELLQASSEEAAARRWRSSVYGRSVLDNSLGRHEAAFDAAREGLEVDDPIAYGTLLVPELAEAASRIHDRAALEQASQWLSERTRVLRSEWASGIDARVRALLSDGASADRLYRESIERLGRTRVRFELARTHLLYGEWLRRERRRVDAREQLRTAFEEFTGMGSEAFGRRAERELLATGERARKRVVGVADELTPQEAQIAQLASNGHRNREIAAQLFISPSTVEYHLRKVYRKLGVSSRTQLARVLR